MWLPSVSEMMRFSPRVVSFPSVVVRMPMMTYGRHVAQATSESQHHTSALPYHTSCALMLRAVLVCGAVGLYRAIISHRERTDCWCTKRADASFS